MFSCDEEDEDNHLDDDYYANDSDGAFYHEPDTQIHINTKLSNIGCRHKCSKEVPAPPIQSAYIRSFKSFAFKYGRVEIRAKTPTGDWLWPGDI